MAGLRNCIERVLHIRVEFIKLPGLLRDAVLVPVFVLGTGSMAPGFGRLLS